MESPLNQARSASRDPKDCRKAMDTLQTMGFGDDAFRSLHHQNGQLFRFSRYLEEVQQFVEDGNNHRVHQRLVYIMLSCPDGALPPGKTFQALAVEAYEHIPPTL